MATSASVLKAALKPELKSELISFFGPAVEDTRLDNFCDAVAGSIASKVLEHLVNFAEIQPGTFKVGADPVTGVGTLL